MDRVAGHGEKADVATDGIDPPGQRGPSRPGAVQHGNIDDRKIGHRVWTFLLS